MKTALVVVAHPDDEVIWVGGTILSEKNYKWTIISLCRKGDKDRAPKFKRVCEALNAKGIISDLDDEKLEELPLEKVASKIEELLPSNNFDFIYTHGSNGEYGHIRHKEVHRAIKKMVEDEKLKGELRFFSYIKSKEIPPINPDLRVMIPNPNAKEYVELKGEIFKRKKELIRDMYGFNENGFEVMCSNKFEAFDR